MNLSRLLIVLGCLASLALAFVVLRLSGPADARNPAWLLSEAASQLVESKTPRDVENAGAFDATSHNNALGDATDAAQPEDTAATLAKQSIESMLRGGEVKPDTVPPVDSSATDAERAGRDTDADGASSGLDRGDKSAKSDDAKKRRSRNKDAGKSKEKAEDAQARQRASALLNDARLAIKNADYDRAIQLLQQSLQENAGNSDAYRSLAGLYHTLGMTAEEMQTYEQWTAAVADDPSARYLLAQSYLRAGMDQDAYAQLVEYERLSAGDVKAYPLRATMYRQLNMRAEEGATLESWTNQVPASPEAHQALGQYYQRMADYGAAAAEYRTVTELNPGNAAAHATLASAYRRLGDLDAAQAELNTAVTLKPGDLNIRMQLGNVYRASGYTDAALDMYQSVIDMEPGSHQAAQANQQILRLQRAAAPAPAKPPKPKTLAVG